MLLSTVKFRKTKIMYNNVYNCKLICRNSSDSVAERSKAIEGFCKTNVFSNIISSSLRQTRPTK